VSWDTIECTERNGAITHYIVNFLNQSAMVIENVVDRVFTATKLFPHTMYTFKVAGVNSGGTGPFTVMVLSTDEEGICKYRLSRTLS
jgi:hypothetical protein